MSISELLVAVSTKILLKLCNSIKRETVNIMIYEYISALNLYFTGDQKEQCRAYKEGTSGLPSVIKIMCSAVQCSEVQCCAVRCSAVQCSAV